MAKAISRCIQSKIVARWHGKAETFKTRASGEADRNGIEGCNGVEDAGNIYIENPEIGRPGVDGKYCPEGRSHNCGAL